jgi:dipeptidyl aminopeptidase/acylaminoacyl peptidase
MKPAAGCALLAVLLVAPTLHAQTPSDRLTLADYLELESVQSPQLSPDEERIVFGRRWVDKVNDRFETSVWVMEVDGSRPRALIDGSSPTWSPDGSRIAYTAQGEPGGQQIFVKYVDVDGPATQITRITESPSDVAWSPDGKTIAFRMRVPDGMWKVRSRSSGRRAPSGRKRRAWWRSCHIVATASASRLTASCTSSSYPRMAARLGR